MTDNERTLHALKKINEILTLTLTHYIPQGKQLPESYRDTLEVLWGVYYDGCLESITSEPLIHEDVTQVVLFMQPKPDEKADLFNGTKLDTKELKDDLPLQQ